MYKICLVVVFMFISVCSLRASILDWQYLETDKFVVFYPEGYDFQAREVLTYLETYNQEIRKITGNQDDFQTRIVIQDPGEIANGYADPINVKIAVYTNDPGSIGDFSGKNWLRDLSVHEFTHISQLTNSSGAAKVFTTLLGNTFSPNVFAPMWIVEGITVFNESQIDTYEGRMNLGYYQAIISSKAKEGRLPNPAQAHYWHDDYPRGQYYIYGGAFFQFLSHRYGKEKVGAFFNKYGYYFWTIVYGHLLPFGSIDIAAKKTFGHSFPVLFEQWRDYEKEVAEDWQMGGEEVISSNQLPSYNIKNITSDGKNLYYFKGRRMSKGFEYCLMKYDPRKNEETLLRRVPGGHIGSIQVVDHNLYFALKEIANGFPNVDQAGKGVEAVLYKFDLAKDECGVLFQDDFINFFVDRDGSVIYAKQRKDAFGTLVRRWHDGNTEELGETDFLIGEILRYEDKYIVTAKDKLNSWNICLFDPAGLQMIPWLNSPWQETKIKLNGSDLYYTANYNSSYGVYRYGIEDNRLTKISTGSFAYDGVICGGKLYYKGLKADGERLFKADIAAEEIPLPAAEHMGNITFSVPDSVKAEGAFLKNLSYLFKPSSRLNLFPAMGQDGLGYNNYWIFLNSAKDYAVDVNFSTTVFNPLVLQFSGVDIGNSFERELSFTGYCPLYQSLRAGLSDVTAYYTTDFHDKVRPGLQSVFTFPGLQMTSSGYGDINREGWLAEQTFDLFFENSGICLTGRYFEDTERTPTINGFSFGDIADAEGYEVEIRGEGRLLKIRNGFWYVNLALGDVYGALFAQHSHIEREINGYGSELIFDVGASWLLKTKVTCGACWSEDEIGSYVKIGIEL